MSPALELTDATVSYSDGDSQVTVLDRVVQGSPLGVGNPKSHCNRLRGYSAQL